MSSETHAEYLARRSREVEAKRQAYEWTEAQKMAARSITLIKRLLEPKCKECGAGVDRPNCAMDMGGGCGRHDQESALAYDEVVSDLERAAQFPDDFDLRYDLAMPLEFYNDFTTDELDLLRDLIDAGGKMSSRRRDSRFNSLSSKRAVYFGVIGDTWEVTIAPRALKMMEK